MKTLINYRYLFSTFLFVAVLTFSACSKDDVSSSDSTNDEVLICDEGFEGANCNTEIRAKFLGDWETDDYGTSSLNSGHNEAHVEFIIERGETISELHFMFENSSLILKSTYEGNMITIPFQDYGTKYEGNLYLTEDDILILDLTIDNNLCVLETSAHLRRSN